jgi:phage FluMu gp28-like protein
MSAAHGELSAQAWFLIEYLDLPEATGDPAAQWEPFQIQHLNNSALFGLARKTRQAGWSWLTSAEGVAEGCLTPRTTNVYVSINQDEATEKIRYARQVIAALDREVRPRLVIDNRLELEFQNGSRLISHPGTPPRGKARANVYLDEFAHYPRDREIYTAALPAATRGGRIRIGSTTLGASGLFWEIATERMRRYPGYRRSFIPWWWVKSLCRNLGEAAKLAAHMLTEERVRLFGTQRLIEIFDNLPLEDFQQEYECSWVDENTAWITWEDIKRNQVDAQAGALWYRQARSVDAALAAINELAVAIKEGKVEPALAVGFDVGRKKDLSEMTFIGKGATAQRPYRLGISLFNTPFDDQYAVAAKALEVLPVVKLLVDQNGLGMQLAEKLNQRFRSRAEGAGFTNSTKEIWAVGLKVEMQRGHVPLPIDRELAYQIHSIKKVVTASKNVVFDTVGNESHHADKFWSLALALAASGVTSQTADYYRQQAEALKNKAKG